MVESEQVRPLGPPTEPRHEEEAAATSRLDKTTRSRRKCIKCCSCIAAVLIIEAVVIVILIFTIFKTKNPIVKMNMVHVDRLDLINGTIPRPGTNMSLTADISGKNPNFVSFRYENTTTSLYYKGTKIGEARSPPGLSKARRTMRMNVTVDIVVDNLLGNPNLQREMNTGLLTIGSYTRIGGRAKLVSFIKKHVIVKMNCTVTVNSTTSAIKEMKCKRKVKL